MTQSALDKKWNDPNCHDLITLAERELAAFFLTITRLFGSEQAEISARDWLDELMAIDHLATDDRLASTRQWRSVTFKVLARLAGRLGTLSDTARTLAYSD